MSGNGSLADGFWTWQRKVNSPDRSERLDADSWIWAVDAVDEGLASSTQESAPTVASSCGFEDALVI
jgi:hypothetical protein